MVMSRNKLLGGGESIEEEVVEKKVEKSTKLYRKDYKKGRVYPPEMLEMMKRKGWREQPFEDEVFSFDSLDSGKKSKIDVSVKKAKPKSKKG